MIMKKIIAIFLLIAVLFMPVAVFADMPIPDPPPGAFHYWAVVEARWGAILLLTSPNSMTAPNAGTEILITGGYRVYDLTDSYWNYYSEGLSSVTYNINHIYAASHDIAYTDGSGFFFTPPKVSALYQTAQKTDFGMVWTIILDGLIPLVGLLILGISFRKGWVFLRNQLTH